MVDGRASPCKTGGLRFESCFLWKEVTRDFSPTKRIVTAQVGGQATNFGLEVRPYNSRTLRRRGAVGVTALYIVWSLLLCSWAFPLFCFPRFSCEWLVQVYTYKCQINGSISYRQCSRRSVGDNIYNEMVLSKYPYYKDGFNNKVVITARWWWFKVVFKWASAAKFNFSRKRDVTHARELFSVVNRCSYL